MISHSSQTEGPLSKIPTIELRRELNSRVYSVVFEGSDTIHGAKTRHASLGTFTGDLMFGGGFSLVCCHRKCQGKAVISPSPVSLTVITCGSDAE